MTDLQVNKYKQLRARHSQEAAAAKTGIGLRSGQRIEAVDVLPSQREARTWRTRSDPFERVWQSEVLPLLERAPTLMAVTVLEELQRREPGRFAESVLRTLQRDRESVGEGWWGGSGWG